MKCTRHALHSCIMARRSSSWLLGLFPSANMGCNPSMAIPPQISTPRLLGKPARIHRQHRLSLSPKNGGDVYARSEPKFTARSEPPPPKYSRLKGGDNEIVSTNIHKRRKGSDAWFFKYNKLQDDLTLAFSNVCTYPFSNIPQSHSDLLIFPRR